MKLKTYASIAVLCAGGMTSSLLYAQGASCQLEISGNDAMQFDKKELKAPASCKEVTLTLKHSGKLPANAMGHNWVLTRTADANGLAADGIKAGLQNNYIPAGDARVIAFTPIIGGGQTTSVKFKTAALKKGESYTYVCTFPGHSAIMRGMFTLG